MNLVELKRFSKDRNRLVIVRFYVHIFFSKILLSGSTDILTIYFNI